MNGINKKKSAVYSTVSINGRTTIPVEVRIALNLRPGDTLEFTIEGDRATIRKRVGLSSLAGVLKCDKGRGLTFDEIRHIAKENDMKRLEREFGPRSKRGKLLICHFDRPKEK